MARIISIFLLALVITGCTTIAPTAPATYKTWEQRETSLKHLHHWQLNGKIAVITPQDSGSATVDWLQKQGHYTINLLGPLGTNGLTLIGQPGFVTLDTGDGKHYNAHNPEQLLAQAWGFHVPVSYLSYWIRGLPVPFIPVKTTFDGYGRLSTIVQQNWQVQFLSYTAVGGTDLPSRLSITSPSLKVKIVIYKWVV